MVRNMQHTCLYSPATEYHCPLVGIHCAYPRRDGQAELTLTKQLYKAMSGMGHPFTYLFRIVYLDFVHRYPNIKLECTPLVKPCVRHADYCILCKSVGACRTLYRVDRKKCPKIWR